MLSPALLCAQERPAVPEWISAPHTADAGATALPDAPQPAQAPQAAQQTSPTSSSQTDAQTQQQKAQEQIKEQEHQRVFGILPAFNTSYRSDAVSLTARQKMSLAFRSAIDPMTFAAALLVAGYGEAADSDAGFPWGAKGFGERAGAKYLDAFDGTMLGNGVLPSILHQDPRYFRLGHGSKAHRFLYAVASSVICKHDVSRRWEPNYSNIGGNILSGIISTTYYPAQESGIGDAVVNGMVVTGEGTVGAEFQEFWPDISRKLFHRDPTHGLDAQMEAESKGKAKTAPAPASQPK